MRRPVGVKSIFAVRGTSLFSRRVATVAMLPSALFEERFQFARCMLAFSFQPVLPSVRRPVVLLLQSGTWARRLTQSPELGFGFCLSLPGTVLLLFCLYCSTRLLPFGGCCATVRTLLRSPTGDAAAPRAFLRWRRWLASSRSFRHAQPASDPSVAGHSRCRTAPRCAALPAPAVFADRGLPLCFW
jgi:hypothetical protein